MCEPTSPATTSLITAISLNTTPTLSACLTLFIPVPPTVTIAAFSLRLHPCSHPLFYCPVLFSERLESTTSWGKIKPDMFSEGGREGGVWWKICTNTSPLVLHFIIDIDGYGLLDSMCSLTMKFIILLLFECIKCCPLVLRQNCSWYTPIKLVEGQPKEQECRRGWGDGRRRRGRECVGVCVLEGRGGFRSLPGSLLGLHSLKRVFYKGPCLAERGKPARVKKKGVGKSSQGCNCCYVGEKYSSVLWGFFRVK